MFAFYSYFVLIVSMVLPCATEANLYWQQIAKGWASRSATV
jgi:hypothetical protein